MDFYNWLLRFPDWLVWLACLVFFSVFCTCILWLTKLLWAKYLDNKSPSTLNNAMIGGMFVLTSFTIVFIANDVWKINESAKNIVSKEAIVAYDTLRVLKQLPGETSNDLQDQLLHYFDTLIQHEWPLMQDSQASPIAEEKLNNLLFTLYPIKVANADANTALLLRDLKSNLDELKNVRDQRLIITDYRVRPEKWFCLLLLMSLCVFSVCDIHQHSRSGTRKSLLILIFGFSTVSFLVLVNDRPFTGTTAIQATGLKQIVQSYKP